MFLVFLPGRFAKHYSYTHYFISHTKAVAMLFMDSFVARYESLNKFYIGCLKLDRNGGLFIIEVIIYLNKI